jgi:hypothetical protein
MTRRHLTWAYLGSQAGPLSELAEDALKNPQLAFQFASDKDRARVRRQVEDAIRKNATDRELVELAVRFGCKL